MTGGDGTGAGYAMHRLSRAVQTSLQHSDPKVRAQAQAKVERWQAVLEGMASGQLSVGSRTPVADTPAWVTLEVAHGGFATGRYMAEGPLLEHELALLAKLPPGGEGETERGRLNAFFLSDDGQAVLRDALERGTYRVDVPEEGAWLVATWLLEAGHASQALDLVAALLPLSHRLRFYPRLEDEARPSGATVHVAPVKEVREALAAIEPRPQIAAMNEAHQVWAPLYDQLVELWLETVEGEAPHLVGEGAKARVAGGWPCRRWPDDWAARRVAWRAAYDAAVRTPHVCGQHHHPKSNFCRLEEALARCPEDSAALSPREVGWIRRALANTVTRRGAPGSEARRALRRAQREVAARPLLADVAHVVAKRLADYPDEGGVPSMAPLRRAVEDGESDRVPAGTAVPEAYARKAARALEAPIAELVEQDIVGSGEVLAQVLPQITAQVAAAGIEDPALRELFGAVYAAFRRRRSLLLLNLEHQVQLEELPWIAALAGERRDDLETKALARQTLEQVTLLALTSFPQTILPNPLVTELQGLVQRAGLELPLVEEVAADIFMGTFTAKWSESATTACAFLEGTLYGRYYDLPAVPEGRSGLLGRLGRAWGKNTAEGFAEQCSARAAEAGSTGGSFVAKNGAILEQSQILTTQNLASLVARLDLTDRLRPVARAMATRSFSWIVRRQNQKPPTWHAGLIMLKNTAYAWRQALFFLSICEESEQREALARLEALVRDVDDSAWRARFSPVVLGLRAVLDGDRFSAAGRAENGGRRFLGWSVGQHWLAE